MAQKAKATEKKVTKASSSHAEKPVLKSNKPSAKAVVQKPPVPKASKPSIKAEQKKAAKSVVQNKKNEKDERLKQEISKCVPIFLDLGLGKSEVLKELGVKREILFAAVFRESRVGTSAGAEKNILQFKEDRFSEDIAKYGATCLAIAQKYEPAVALKLAPVVQCVTYEDNRIVLNLKAYHALYKANKNLPPKLNGAILALRKDPHISTMLYVLSNYDTARKMKNEKCPGELEDLADIAHILGGGLALDIAKGKPHAKVIDICKKNSGTMSSMLSKHALSPGISRNQFIDKMGKRHKTLVTLSRTLLEEVQPTQPVVTPSATDQKTAQDPASSKVSVLEVQGAKPVSLPGTSTWGHLYPRTLSHS